MRGFTTLTAKLDNGQRVFTQYDMTAYGANIVRVGDYYLR